jgi:hypothetical protein
MTEPNFAAFKVVLKLLGAAPQLYEKVQQWRGRPTKEDQQRLVSYCRRIDERRVFSAPYNVEVEEVCVASLSQVKEFTDEALAGMEDRLLACELQLAQSAPKPLSLGRPGASHRVRPLPGQLRTSVSRKIPETLC